VLIFSRTKHGADKVARKLEQQGVRTGTLHSNRSQNQRLRALKDFKSGLVRVLVATDIAARGIDVDGISHVVNYDFPKHPEDYVHRIGRTGRALAIGEALSFATPEDHAGLRALERFIGRGLVRKRAEGFNYHARSPGKADTRVPDKDSRFRHQTSVASSKEHPALPMAHYRANGPKHQANGARSSDYGTVRHMSQTQTSNAQGERHVANSSHAQGSRAPSSRHRGPTQSRQGSQRSGFWRRRRH
jgi:ATP-dependent RNA helicase RhlE